MDVASEELVDMAVARIAGLIGEPARARILFSLMDGHARTSTELAVVAGVSPSTASIHLKRLTAAKLLRVAAQGKHRYYTLEGPKVARVLEGLGVLAGGSTRRFEPHTPSRLRLARTCYDHIAGAFGVAVHDRVKELGWLSASPLKAPGCDYELTSKGERGFEALGIRVDEIKQLRRRFAYACLDWSERRPHLGGALGSALLALALHSRWVDQEPDCRALSITRAGRSAFLARLGVHAPDYRKPTF